jgi:hypothetical protein
MQTFPKSLAKFREIVKDDGGLPFQNVSAAIEFDSTLWLGVFMGNRIAYRPVQ